MKAQGTKTKKTQATSTAVMASELFAPGAVRFA